VLAALYIPVLGQTTAKNEINYDVVDQINFVNNGSDSANVDLVVALIHSIAPYQDVISTEINPQYKEYFSDDYGNQYARFVLTNLASGGRTGIEIRYQVAVHDIHFKLNRCYGPLPKEFVNAEKYIESEASPIINLEKQLTQGKKTTCEKSEAFYNYVANNINYNYTTNEIGALETLRTLSGDCKEYSDLLTALNRAAGIPSITVEGLLGNTTSGYIEGENLHKWLEVYLPDSGWVPMDPTLGRFPQDRAIYFAGMTPDHIIITKGQWPPPLDGYNDYTYNYSGGNLVVEDMWSIKEHI
jgi:transglutaminase-like putative cysteine protease